MGPPVVVGLEWNVAKVVEFYVRDLFPRTVKRKDCTPGQVVEFPERLKHLVLDSPVRTLESQNLEEGCEKSQYRGRE